MAGRRHRQSRLGRSCLVASPSPPPTSRREKKKKSLIGPARSNFSVCPCDQVSSQVQRSPSPRSLATACFLWPLEIVLAPRHTAAFHDSFVLNQAGPGPFATTLCSLICVHINLPDVRRSAVVSILPLSARLSTTSPPIKTTHGAPIRNLHTFRPKYDQNNNLLATISQ